MPPYQPADSKIPNRRCYSRTPSSNCPSQDSGGDCGPIAYRELQFGGAVGGSGPAEDMPWNGLEGASAETCVIEPVKTRNGWAVATVPCAGRYLVRRSVRSPYSRQGPSSGRRAGQHNIARRKRRHVASVPVAAARCHGRPRRYSASWSAVWIGRKTYSPSLTPIQGRGCRGLKWTTICPGLQAVIDRREASRAPSSSKSSTTGRWPNVQGRICPFEDVHSNMLFRLVILPSGFERPPVGGVTSNLRRGLMGCPGLAAAPAR